MLQVLNLSLVLGVDHCQIGPHSPLCEGEILIVMLWRHCITLQLQIVQRGDIQHGD